SHAGSWNRRSPRTGAASETPTATRPRSATRDAASRAVARGRRTREAASLTVSDPGIRRRSPLDAAINSWSRPTSLSPTEGRLARTLMDTPFLTGGPERLDDGAELCGRRDEGQMAVRNEMELGIGKQPGEDAGVERRDELVVVAVQHQCLLPDQGQVGQARPPEHGEHLVPLATVVRDQPLEDVEELGVVPYLPAVELDRYVPASHRVEPPGGDDLPGDGPRRLDERARPGADEDEAPAPSPVLEGEVLGQRTAPGHTEHIGGGNVEVPQQDVDHPADLRKEVGAPRTARLTDTRRVETDEAGGRIQLP